MSGNIRLPSSLFLTPNPFRLSSFITGVNPSVGHSHLCALAKNTWGYGHLKSVRILRLHPHNPISKTTKRSKTTNPFNDRSFQYTNPSNTKPIQQTHQTQFQYSKSIKQKSDTALFLAARRPLRARCLPYPYFPRNMLAATLRLPSVSSRTTRPAVLPRRTLAQIPREERTPRPATERTKEWKRMMGKRTRYPISRLPTRSLVRTPCEYMQLRDAAIKPRVGSKIEAQKSRNGRTEGPRASQ